MSIMSTYRLTLSQSSCDIEAPLTRYARQREYIKISELHYRSGQHNTELDLLVVRQQQLRRVKECKALLGEYVTTEHRQIVFEVCIKQCKEKRTMGPTNIKWWKCKDEMMVECRERVRRKYEDLDAEKGTVEGERRQYKDAFIGVAEELCGRTSGKGGTPRSRNQGWGTEEVAKAVVEKREAWKMIEGIRDRGEQPSTSSLSTYMYGQKKEGGGQNTEEYGGRNVPKA